ncbi:MAG TPA: response regulator transcription factor [Vicinamibacterales bacterium]|jgi:DNA-binding NarL/FixJ family response regulator|nr:response regulator transcription factor [Vicinamibacterales bacterium]
MSAAPKVRVLCVDDHAVVREGIAAIINLQPDMTLVASASTGRDALQQYRAIRPDVTLMDLRLSDMSGFDAIRAIRAEFPDARVIVLSSYEGDADIRQAMDAGARGYVAKGMVREELLAVIRSVHAGKRRLPAELASTLAEHLSDDQLSPREIEVLQHVSAGKLNKEIAAELSLAEGTVKMHVRNILSKLGASDRTEAVTVALRRGIIRL